YIETFVTPTGIIVNVDNKDTQPVTIVRTIERRGFNLSKVVAVTNSIRDFISGDLISGTIRGVEALLASIAIAGGVGLGLSLYLLLF
nr:threonine/serine exporter family protein [Clostridia bacterium]